MIRARLKPIPAFLLTLLAPVAMSAEEVPQAVEPTEYTVIETGDYDRDESIQAAKNRALDSIPDKFSAISLVTRSNEPSCVKLTIEGVQLWLVVTYTPIPTVTVQMSIQVSHYNPDFIVSSYPRLGASPIKEADLMYDWMQTKIAKEVVELISGRDHDLMEQEKQFGGHYGESGGSRRQMMYSEAEVIGHPGNLYSLAGLVLSGNYGRLTQAPIEIASAVATTPIDMAEQVADIGDVFVGDSSGLTIPTTTGNWAQWNGPGLGDTSEWTDEVLRPLAFHEDIRQIIEAAEFGNSLTNAVSSFGDITEEIEETLSDPLGAITDAVLASEEVESVTTEIDEALGDIEALDTILDIASDPELNTGDYEILEEQLRDLGLDDEQISETMSGIEDMDSQLENQETSAGGVLFSFCPSDATMYAPYYLPGVNVVGWRFGLPEMVYRNSYAMPTQNSELFIGKFNDDDVNDITDREGNRPAWLDQVSLPQWSTWSSIYPRTGWVSHSDPIKARASAAFRAAHIVTRPDQAHVYLHPEKRTSGFKRADTRGGLSPNDLETGAWQMVKPKISDQCSLMQDSDIETELFERRDDFEVNADTGEATLTDGSLTSSDGTYVWNLWRHYECAVKPIGDVVTELVYIPLGDGVTILD